MHAFICMYDGHSNLPYSPKSVYLCVCVCGHVYFNVSVHVYLHAHMHTYSCVHTNRRIQGPKEWQNNSLHYAWLRIKVHELLYAYKYIHASMNTYIHQVSAKLDTATQKVCFTACTLVHIHIHLYTYPYMYIHTHIHTCIIICKVSTMDAWTDKTL